MGRNRNRQRQAEPVTVEEPTKNSLSSAIGLGGGMIPSGLYPSNQGSPWSEQLSQPTTIFKNLRWYLVSNMRQVLSEAYVELGLVQTIVDLPIDDALRGGVEIKSEELNEEQVKELLTTIKRKKDLITVGQAAKWNRLYGGAGIITLTDQDPSTPLDMEAIDENTPLKFRAVDMWELFWTQQNTEEYDVQLQEEVGNEFYDYYGEKLHKSRVMPLKGLEAPSFIRPRLRGWGFSVVEILVRSINQYLKATDLAFEVLDEFKIDVYKIKGFTQALMNPAAEQQVKRRIQLANYQKNYQHALSMDVEDDWDHKQLSFAGLGDAMLQIRMQVASDMRMPITKLFGISAAGFNSGEDDIEVYNSMVESTVRNKIEYDILRICELRCQQLFGFIPEDLSLTFKPLRVMSAEQEETIKTQKFARLSQALSMNQIDTKTFHDACNRDNLIGVTLNEEEMELLENEVGEDSPEELDSNGNPKSGGGRASGNNPRKTPQTKKAPTKPQRTANAGWDESKHPRDSDGKFGKGAAPTDDDRAAFKKKYPAWSGSTPHSTGYTETEALAVVKQLRTDGVFATASHMDGPKTGKKSRYFVMVPESKKNVATVVQLPKPFTRVERTMRRLVNSAAFDRESYMADGGDDWIDGRRYAFFTDAKALDKQLWTRAHETAVAVFGEDRWQFQVWWYVKHGGKFE